MHPGGRRMTWFPAGVARDGGKMRAVREAVAERQPAFGGARDVVLAQVRDGIGQRSVEFDAPVVGEAQDHRRRGDDLRERGEVEPVVLGQRLKGRNERRVSGVARRATSIRGDEGKGRAGDAAFGDRPCGGRESAFDQLVQVITVCSAART